MVWGQVESIGNTRWPKYKNGSQEIIAVFFSIIIKLEVGVDLWWKGKAFLAMVVIKSVLHSLCFPLGIDPLRDGPLCSFP